MEVAPGGTDMGSRRSGENEKHQVGDSLQLISEGSMPPLGQTQQGPLPTQ